MNRCLVPEVRCNSYDMIFTPVRQPHDKLGDVSRQSLFIVEIQVRPLVHMVYMVYQTHKCYKRQGRETIECTVTQRKEELMEEEEQSVRECMQLLEASANNDSAKLIEFLNKFVLESKQT
ncbi:hypothetical protein L9F63_012837 [Diploptera punctata]|uniref:Uncharacterized protein n=1 Tax=Diploptera punctata TaxID=6984 RepID=A0AAD8ABD2_DIPPU|nr:hypothetical protein L9F63_012837 [Diploptera punctata]